LGTFIKYPKESLPLKPTSHVADKKYGVFQADIPFFNELTQELGLISTSTDGKVRYARHPLAYLVEAADDICYTIIDFEDGINMGLIDEEFALEYLIKLVKDTIDTKKYHQLKYKKDRLSYLRALAIGTLINEAATVFIENENAILNGEYSHSLLDKCRYEAQISDIIKISIEKVYRSREVIEKELAGYKVISILMDAFLNALNNKFENSLTNYDKLVLALLPESLREPNSSLYLRLLAVSSYIASLTDGFALQLYKKLIP
jgi:dGTPase